MKKVFAFALFAIILTACDSTAKYKPMIEELSSNWDNATSQVTEFSTMVMDEQSSLMNLKSSMQVAPDKMKKWNEATKSQFTKIQEATEASTTNLTSLSSQVDAFVTSWQEKGNELKALKDGLAAGKLEGDVQSKISSLTAAATDATAKLDTWKTQFAEIKASAANAQKMFADFSQSNNMSDVR